MGQVLLFSLIPLPLFSWHGSMTAPKREKPLAQGNGCRWPANAIEVPRYSSSGKSQQLLLSWAGFQPIFLTCWRRNRDLHPACVLCLYTDPYVLVLTAGCASSAWNCSQAATGIAATVDAMPLWRQMKVCETLPGVNFQEAVEHLTVWLPLELMEA